MSFAVTSVQIKYPMILSVYAQCLNHTDMICIPFTLLSFRKKYLYNFIAAFDRSLSLSSHGVCKGNFNNSSCLDVNQWRKRMWGILVCVLSLVVKSGVGLRTLRGPTLLEDGYRDLLPLSYLGIE